VACRPSCPPDTVRKGPRCVLMSATESNPQAGSDAEGVPSDVDSEQGEQETNSIPRAGSSGETDGPRQPAKNSVPMAGSKASGDSPAGGSSGDMPRCGNGKKERGESCDGDCPTDCQNPNTCLLATASGSAAMCDLQCKVLEINACKSGDGCCPAGCVHATDVDCSAKCGDGVVESRSASRTVKKIHARPPAMMETPARRTCSLEARNSAVPNARTCPSR
jgi:hypothetical protein